MSLLLFVCRASAVLAWLGIGGFIVSGFAAVAPGDVPPSKETVEKNELTVEAVAERRSALQKEIATTRGELRKLPEGKLDETALWLTQETALLERLDALHVEQQRTLQHAADLAKEAADVEER